MYISVKCKDQLIPALLFVDDMVMFAEDEEMLRRALVVLGEWCEEWSVKVNVDKCGVMDYHHHHKEHLSPGSGVALTTTNTDNNRNRV